VEKKQIKKFKWELDNFILDWWGKLDFEPEPEIEVKIDERSLTDRRLERIFRDLNHISHDLGILLSDDLDN